MATGITGLAGALREIERAIAGALEETVEAHAERVATEARANHPYTDRTGALTASIEALPASGNALDGQLRGFVVAGAEHAEYVESNPSFAFLEPAAHRLDADLVRAAEVAIERATR